MRSPLLKHDKALDDKVAFETRAGGRRQLRKNHASSQRIKTRLNNKTNKKDLERFCFFCACVSNDLRETPKREEQA